MRALNGPRFRATLAHTGYVPVTLDPNQLATRWQLAVPTFLYFNSLFNLATVTTANGIFYMAGNNAVTAHSVPTDQQHDLELQLRRRCRSSSAEPARASRATAPSTWLCSRTAILDLPLRSGREQWFREVPLCDVCPVGKLSRSHSGALGRVHQCGARSTAAPMCRTPSIRRGNRAVLRGHRPTIRLDTRSRCRRRVRLHRRRAARVRPGDGCGHGRPCRPDVPRTTSTRSAARRCWVHPYSTAAYGNSWLNGGGIGNALVHFNLQTNAVDWSIHGESYPPMPAYRGRSSTLADNNPLSESGSARRGRRSSTWSGHGRRAAAGDT